MKYFAYGSNMCSSRLRQRVPSATFFAIAQLRGYHLRFHKRSQDGSAKCNVVRTNAPEDGVIGVVFEIDPAEKPRLDAAEGLCHGYHEETLLLCSDHGDLCACAYIADPEYVDDELLPYTWYKDFVIAGAREHRLPSSYVEALLAVAAQDDPDAAREAEERRVLPCSGALGR